MQKDYLEVILEDMNSKFDLVLEGHESIRGEIRDLAQKTEERFDLVDFKIDTLNQKIDAVDEKLTRKIDTVDEKLTRKIDDVADDLKATDARLGGKIDAVASDLKAHRADTEAHHGVYQVKEG